MSISTIARRIDYELKVDFMMDEVKDGWSVPWNRKGHFKPEAVRAMDFERWRPHGWYYARKTRVYVRPVGAPWVNDIEIEVEGVSEKLL